MSGRRRRLLGAMAAGAGLLPWTALRAGITYPTRPVMVIVPFGPGGLADISARLIAEKLGVRLGHEVLVENRPGGGGIVAANAALAAARDGHTLILFTNGTTIAKSLYKFGHDPEVDFVPVSSLAYFDLVLLTGKSSAFKDLATLLSEGRKRGLMFGSINPGSTQHLSAELFKSVAGLHATVVPYNSSPQVLAALMRGELDLGFESYAALKGGIDSGQVRPLAVTGPARNPWLPHVPTVREAGLPGYEVTGWNAVYATRGTPQAVVDILNRHIRDILKMPDVRKRLLELGTQARGSSPAELAVVFDRDTRKWANVIRQADIEVQ